MLGFCLGLQLLATTSQKFRLHAGLNLMFRKVLPIAAENSLGERRKVTFIGWAKLTTSKKYSEVFIHIIFSPDNVEHLVATYDYRSEKIKAAVRSGNICAFQLHAEKSGGVGLGLLRAFLQV